MNHPALVGCLLLVPLAACSSSTAGGPNDTGGAGASGQGGGASGSSASSAGSAASGVPTTAGSGPSGNSGSGGSAGATGSGGGSAGTGGSPGEGCATNIELPTLAELKANPKMPDPFTFLDGSKVTSKADWACRRKEISLLAEEFIYGKNPGKPESIEATYSGGSLSITVTNGGKTIEFSVTIRAASGGGGGPTPAIFSIGASAPAGVATIDYGRVGERLAKSTGSQGRRAPSGLFYDLYPDYKSTGSLMAWAWGASRVIDALEMTTGHNIDTTKLSALGCSRNGKEAGIIGLFDERIALVAAQSPGSGLASGWRPAEAEKSAGANVQTASQIYGEENWMGDAFESFGNSNVNKLPIDQHEVLALAWPRPLIIMEGTNDGWNCPKCVYTTMKYTQMIYEALGSKDHLGFPHPPHGHCAQAGTFATEYYSAFVNRFLKGESVSTEDLFTDSFTFDAGKWQDGEIPTLD
ncbi:glucuronyl esterase domain-containing protein [Sorangium sp. So ce128]|uniref:glucuronyl esterase domain-containing protein n=1 Tax=Sorangium sp. So ce128 TaxID=3133281 RepID=UPI003F612641